MFSRTLQYIALIACLALEYSVLVSSTIVVSQPSASTTWTPGETYEIKIRDDHADTAVRNWQVDLMVLGGECEDICLHDGVVSKISHSYSTQSTLWFKVPTDLAQHGKGFQVQFSSAGSPPIYHSEIFTIERPRSKRRDKEQEVVSDYALDQEKQQLQQRGLSPEVEARQSENAAPFVLPAVLATTLVLGFSCVFAFFMI